MGKPISIPYKLTADPGTEEVIPIWTVDKAKIFRMNSVRISFPQATYYELEIALQRGIKQIAPHIGKYVGDNEVINDELEAELESGSELKLYYKNLNTTQIRECSVLVRGELE